MKTYNIAFSNGTKLSFSLPEFLKKDRKLLKLLKVFYVLSVSFFFVFLFILPMSGNIFSGINFESNVLNFVAYSILILTVLYLGMVVLGGKKWLIDPVNFLSVLVFGLFTTMAAVLASPSNISNTFGVSVLRGVSGLFVMLAIGIFYLTNVFVRDLQAIKKAIFTLTAGFITMLIVLASNSFYDPTVIPVQFVNLSPLFVLLAFVALFVKTKKFALVTLALSVALTFLYFANYRGNLLNAFYVLSSGFFASLILGLFYIFNNKQFLAKRIQELRTMLKKFKKADKFEFLNKVFSLSYLLIPVILLGILVLIMAQNSIGLNRIYEKVHHISIALSNVVNNNVGGTPVTRLTVGLGGRILNTEFSLLSNIVAAQGLLGIIAYLYLGILAVYNGFKVLKQLFVESTYYKLVALLVFILIFVPILSFLTYPGLLWIILWWISFALVSVLKHISDKKNAKGKKKSESDEEIEFKLAGLSFKRRPMRAYPAIIHTLLLCIVLLVGGLILVGFSNLRF